MAKAASKRAKKGLARAAAANSPAARALPKSAQIVSLLRRENGASIPEIMKATGWQAHSVRGFISGTLKRKQGLAITSTTETGKDRRYLIAGAG
jgi:hypothetical protein